MLIPEGLQCVEKHNVKVASQPAVLKGIVKNQKLWSICLKRHARRGHAVRILNMGHARQLSR
jgi:hypothetical protein